MAKANGTKPNGHYMLVEIRWRDACGDSTWQDPKDLTHTLTSVVSVGYLMGENQKAVTLAATISQDSDGAVLVNDIQVIPKTLMTTRKVLHTLRLGG